MRMIFICLLFANAYVYSQQKTELSKENLTILDGLVLKYNTIQKLSDSITTFLDQKPISVQRFTINSNVTVQTSCRMVGRGTYDKIKANYLIEIGVDTKGSLKKKFVDSIYNYWEEKDEKYLERYKSSSDEIHLFYANGDYVFYKKPSSNKVGDYYIFYFKNKIIKVSFKGFDTERGFGGLSEFLNELVQFRFERNQINPKYEVKFDPRLFMKLYEEDFFHQKSKQK
ncbi:hypothetical protein C8N46_11277 [Kordia periserrulae]|uniref:Uncharacterized protein n=1 Tax=Kordia periserrulae TaxID=701523 RepID=A0A2T6BRU9_9FLAO|nr:hypothetical protein [Kordia periserrulae]PTX58769.1 hypothetical protein C8N46_11277 [Kordia periserrulae]